MTWLYLIKNKSEVFSHFQNFTNLVETQYNTKIKILRTDNGTEFINKKIQTLQNLEALFTKLLPERKNHHLLEMTRTLLFQNNNPKTFWLEAVLTAPT
jgi:uncharacterized protein (DUF2344 family)